MTKIDLPGLNLPSLERYLTQIGLIHEADRLFAELATGGRSNLTYFISNNSTKFVLRRRPLGHLQSTAHDMSREYRIIGALNSTGVAVPKAYHYCEEESVIGAPFYLMEHVEGSVINSQKETAQLGKEVALEISHKVIDTLTTLHECDANELGLSDFGRPVGFLERQLSRWAKQLEGSRSRDISGIDSLLASLQINVPESKRNSIVHGDFRLDNCIIAADNSVAAVVDWEMATLGDSYTDLGLFVVYWDGLEKIGGQAIASGIRREFGFPSAHELLNRYSGRSGSDLSHIEWYIAFGYFKLAVILEGIHLRYTQGKTVGVGFEEIGPLVEPLVACGLSALRGE